MTTTYDRVMHLLGALSLGVLGLSANPDFYKHLPWWVMAGASIIAFVVQTTTMPAADRPDTIAKVAATNAIKGLPVVLLLAAGLALMTGCPPTPPPGTAATPVQTFDACSTDNIKSAGISHLGDVARATLTGDYIGALAVLATTYGIPEIRCAVQLFVDTTARKAAMDTTAQLQRERAQAWLAKQVP